MRLRATAGWAVTVLLAAAGCGQTSGTNDMGSGAGGADVGVGTMSLDYVGSGTRVVALGYASQEARVFRTFHDQALGIDCNFVADAEERDLRCVPTQQLPLIFTDAGCTQPAAWVERWADEEVAATGDLVSAGVHATRDSCPGDLPEHLSAYRVGERLTEEALGRAPLPVYGLSGGSCAPVGPPGKIAPAVYRLVPLADSELARAQRVSVPVSDGLRVTRLVSDDGAHLNLFVTDAEQAPCALQRDGECVPEPVAHLQVVTAGGHASAALDSDCSIPAFTVSQPRACGSAKFGVEDDGVHAPKVRALEPVSGYFGWTFVLPVTDPLTYACEARQSDDAGRITAPGKDLTGTLPTATRLRRGHGSLHVDWYAVGEQELLPVLAEFSRASPGVVPIADFVNDAGQVCTVQEAEDGTLRCAILDHSSGEPVADWSTFPIITPFTY